MEKLNILSCPKCEREVEIKRSEDPADIDRRYSIGCDHEDCGYYTRIYGPTKNIVVKRWNDSVSHLNIGGSTYATGAEQLKPRKVVENGKWGK